MARLLARLGLASARHRVLVFVLWAAAAVGLGITAMTGLRFADGGFSIPGTESSRAMEVMEQKFGSTAGDSSSPHTLQLVLGAREGESITDPRDSAVIDAALAELSSATYVESVSDPFDPAAPYVSVDNTTAVATVQIKDADQEGLDRSYEAVVAVADGIRDNGLVAEVGGTLGQEVPEVLGPTEVVGALLAFLVLIITYGSLVAAGSTMLGALVGVAVGVLGVLAFSVAKPIGSTTPILAVMLGLAVGIDYCLFIAARFRSELREGRNVEDAIGRAVGTAGSAVVFAGSTVVIALAGLSVVGIGFITEMGVAAAFAVIVAVLMSLTLLPALLAGMGRRALPRRERAGIVVTDTLAAGSRLRFLERWIQLVTRRPVTMLVAAISGLLVLAIPVLSLNTALSTPGGEDPHSTQRAAYNRVAESFGAGAQSPLIVLVEGADASNAVPAVMAVLERLDDVQVVRPAGVSPDGAAALVQVTPSSGPVDERTEQLVRDIRSESAAVEGVSLSVTGETAVGIDTDDKLSTALVTYLVLIVGLSLVLLVVLFRSLLVPLIATAGFLLSLGAGVGVMVAVFQWGWLDQLITAPQGNPVLSLLPILVVGILFGLAMDYQVFLVSRMYDAHRRGLSPVEAVRDGFGRAAVVVVAAATIMAAVFAGFALSPSSLVGSIGLALTVGVLADAFVVRMVVVPALLTLLGERAWWLPGWLDRILPQVDTEGHALDSDTPETVADDKIVPVA